MEDQQKISASHGLGVLFNKNDTGGLKIRRFGQVIEYNKMNYLDITL